MEKYLINRLVADTREISKELFILDGIENLLIRKESVKCRLSELQKEVFLCEDEIEKLNKSIININVINELNDVSSDYVIDNLPTNEYSIQIKQGEGAYKGRTTYSLFYNNKKIKTSNYISQDYNIYDLLQCAKDHFNKNNKHYHG